MNVIIADHMPTEGHIDLVEAQINQIDLMGSRNYLVEQITLSAPGDSEPDRRLYQHTFNARR